MQVWCYNLKACHVYFPSDWLSEGKSWWPLARERIVHDITPVTFLISSSSMSAWLSRYPLSSPASFCQTPSWQPARLVWKHAKICACSLNYTINCHPHTFPDLNTLQKHSKNVPKFFVHYWEKFRWRWRSWWIKKLKEGKTNKLNQKLKIKVLPKVKNLNN